MLSLLSYTLGASWQCGTPLSDDTDAVRREYTAWKKQYLQDRSGTEGAGTCCINRGQTTGNDCVSEGVGYGMLLSAYLDDRDTFQCLWGFMQAHIDESGLMNWRIGPDGSIWGHGGATDADEDIVMALLLGCDAFGDDDVCSAAAPLLTHMMVNETDVGGAIKPGDNFGGCEDPTQPYFSPAVNPSYFAPAYYSRFGKASGDSAAWARAQRRVFEITGAVADGTTGFLPDWSDCKGLGSQYQCGEGADPHCKA